MLCSLPNELIINIVRFIRFPEDLRALAQVNMKIFVIVKTHFIQKEKWENLYLIKDKMKIYHYLRSGYRFIKFNKKIERVYNFIGINFDSTSCQIITSKDIICGKYYENYKLNNTSIEILTEAPYYFKKLPLKLKSNFIEN